jgi:hypothetical protein
MESADVCDRQRSRSHSACNHEDSSGVLRVTPIPFSDMVANLTAEPPSTSQFTSSDVPVCPALGLVAFCTPLAAESGQICSANAAMSTWITFLCIIIVDEINWTRKSWKQRSSLYWIAGPRVSFKQVSVSHKFETKRYP